MFEIDTLLPALAPFSPPLSSPLSLSLSTTTKLLCLPDEDVDARVDGEVRVTLDLLCQIRAEGPAHHTVPATGRKALVQLVAAIGQISDIVDG
jgi:hypothetical protein